MNGVTKGIELSKKVCEIIGIEFDNVVTVDISITPDELVKITVNKYVTVKQEEKLVRLFDCVDILKKTVE